MTIGRCSDTKYIGRDLILVFANTQIGWIFMIRSSISFGSRMSKQPTRWTFILDQMMRMSTNNYRIFASPDHDWFMLAVGYIHRWNGELRGPVLYQGHSREKALEAMIEDMGFEVPETQERTFDDTYEPKESDWE